MKVLIETDDLCVECADAIIDVVLPTSLSLSSSGEELRAKERSQAASYRKNNLEQCRIKDREKAKRYYSHNRVTILRKRQELREQRLYGSGY